MTNGFGIFEGKKPSLSSAEETKDAIEQNEQQTLAEQNLKQTIESESKKEVAESEETSLEEKTEDATKASEAEKTVKNMKIRARMCGIIIRICLLHQRSIRI